MELSWYYLSFADDEKFRGGVIIEGFSDLDAVSRSHMCGLNPGGEVMMIPVPNVYIPPEKFRNRLLSKDDVFEMWPDAARLGDIEDEESARGV
jgi:hypothetical protein